MLFRTFLIMMLFTAQLLLNLRGQAPPGQAGDEAVARAFLRLPVRVDDEMLLSDFLLEADVATVGGVPLDVFAQTAGTPTGRAFARLLAALEAGRVEEAGSYHRPNPFAQIEGQELAVAYARGFEGAWEGARVLRRYALGPEDVIVWEMTFQGQAVPRGFRIDSDFGPQEPFWLESQSPEGLHALKTVITDAERLMTGANDGFVPEAAAEGRRFRQLVPGTDAAWRFDGTPVDWDAFDEQAEVPDLPAAAFYAEACAALRSGDAEAYAAFFSPASAQRFRDWVSETGEEGYQGYVNDMTEAGRRVLFFLDASPVTYVFYLTRDGQMNYEALHRTEADGPFRIVSFFAYGLLDNILQDEDFFERPVILAVAGAGQPLAVGTPPTEEVPEDPSSVGIASGPRAAGGEDIETRIEEPDSRNRPGVLIAILLGALVIGLLAFLIHLAQKRK